jgi:hypothetical protein
MRAVVAWLIILITATNPTDTTESSQSLSLPSNYQPTIDRSRLRYVTMHSTTPPTKAAAYDAVCAHKSAMKWHRVAVEKGKGIQPVSRAPFRASTYPVIPESTAMPAMKASKSVIEGSSSDADSGGRLPALAASIIGTAKMAPTHQVATIPQAIPSKVGD